MLCTCISSVVHHGVILTSSQDTHWGENWLLFFEYSPTSFSTVCNVYIADTYIKDIPEHIHNIMVITIKYVRTCIYIHNYTYQSVLLANKACHSVLLGNKTCHSVLLANKTRHSVLLANKTCHSVLLGNKTWFMRGVFASKA